MCLVIVRNFNQKISLYWRGGLGPRCQCAPFDVYTLKPPTLTGILIYITILGIQVYLF